MSFLNFPYDFALIPWEDGPPDFPNFTFSRNSETETVGDPGPWYLPANAHVAARFRASSAEVRGMFLNLSEVI